MRKKYMVYVASVSLLILVVAGGLFLFASHGGNASGTTSTSPCGKWQLVQSINPSSGANYFLAVAAASTHDVWAVGSTSIPAQGLAEHWNGTVWKQVNISLPPHAMANSLNAVTAINAHDVWAAGVIDASVGSQTLIEHWDGLRWSIIPSPLPNAQFASFASIHALSASNIWAVGGYIELGSSSPVTLIEHWNGSQWSIIPSPNPGTNGDELTSIAALSANNLWAVGYYSNSGSLNQTLIEHWNGSVWQVVLSPSIQAKSNYLTGVSATSSNDVWAVGYSSTQYGSDMRTLIEHWNGFRWSIIASPNSNSGPNMLWGVVALSPQNVWAVGAFSGNSVIKNPELIEHWDGVEWKSIASPNPKPFANTLLAVTNVPGTSQVWAVGNHFISKQLNVAETFSEVYC